MIARVSVRNDRPSTCPFAGQRIDFELRERSVVWLRGPSGVGKSTIAAGVCGLLSRGDLDKLGMKITVEWSPERNKSCGALFQSTTLIDELSVEANVCLAVESTGLRDNVRREAKRLIEAVGLSYSRDGPKAVSMLSGGMARRASLALQLAQEKEVVVLDEPFAGLDSKSARAVAGELRRVRESYRTAYLLIEHQAELARLVGGDDTTSVDVEPATSHSLARAVGAAHPFAYRLSRRFKRKLCDFFVYSLPLVLCGLGAAGLATSMLSADLLARGFDVRRHVDDLVDQHVLPLVDTLLKSFGKDDVSPLAKAMAKSVVKTKSRALVDEALPPTRRFVYAAGLSKLFVLELGPLLAGLLLAGRLGGSYAGQVATMQATDQNKLLLTLGVGPRRFSLLPALMAALVAVPLLTASGTCLALYLAGLVGHAKFGDGDWFWKHVNEAVFPEIRRPVDFVRLATWPPAHLVLKAVSYATLIVLVAEFLSRRKNLQVRSVPNAITASVVTSSLAIILADWLFSQLLLVRDHEII